MKKYIGIDVGGTFIKYGIINEEGHVVEKYEKATEAQKGGKEVLLKIESIIEELLKFNRIEGICISTAGIVDDITGSIVHAGNTMPGYIGIKLKESIENKFGIRCEVENDVNCAAIAEYSSGVAKNKRIVVCLTVGTGIGGAIIIDGKLFKGSNNSACEIGYMNMFNSTFEELASTNVISKKVAEYKKDDIKNWNGIKIFNNAKMGDKICIDAIDEMVDFLCAGISNICYVLNPDIVVLGGGIMAQKDYLNDKINTCMDKYLIDYIRKNTIIEFAYHKNNAGLLGAFYNFTQKNNNNKI